jgi:hypothetical protein
MNSSLAGLVAGAIHHYVIQYPYQANLLMTLYVFALANVLFAAMLFGSMDAPSEFFRLGPIFKDVLIFNTVYVRPFSRQF